MIVFTWQRPDGGQMKEYKTGIMPVQNCDLKDCVSVIKNSFKTVADEFGVTEENAPRFIAFNTDEERINYQRYLEDRPMFGYFQRNKLVGYYSLFSINGEECELNGLCVLPEYRHRHIGEKLLKHSIEQAKSHGFTRMVTGIFEDKAELRTWFENNGFVHTGTKKYDFLPFMFGYMETEIDR